MPVKRQDAHRALELLEDYHNRLSSPDDKALRQAIERVIKIFKSKLFQALLDIQEFYEVTLLDENKSTEQKTVETMKVADRWANSQGITPPPSHQPGAPKPKSHKSRRVDSPEHPPVPDQDERHVISSPQAPAAPVTTTPANGYPGDPSLLEDILLDRGDSGFGFSIAGGIDAPHFSPEDPSIYVTRVVPDGAAALDGRLKINDTIFKVNGIDVTAVTHESAVSVLKMAGRQMRLYVRHNPHLQQIALPNDDSRVPFHLFLTKTSKGLGFSIAGGVGNEHLEGDQGIFITRIIEGGPAAADGRIQLGDRLVAVNDVPLLGVTHEQAVATLKATGNEVKLSLIKATPAELAAMVSDDPDFAVQPPLSLPPQPPLESPSDLPGGSFSEFGDPSFTEVIAEDLPRGQRLVTLKRGSTGLGFNIVGGENGEGIFISFILTGGPADLSSALHRGDQLLEVNGVDLLQATHDQAAAALKGAGEIVQLLAAYRPEDYNRFETHIHDLREQMMTTTGNASGGALRTTQKRSLYVRALFEYDPTKDTGLPNKGIAFRHGDILHVTNASDDEWWQARRLNSRGEEEGLGIIPSRKRIERRERAKLRKVNFNSKTPGPTVPASSTNSNSAVNSGGTLEKDKKKKSSLLRKLHIGSKSGKDGLEEGSLEEGAASASNLSDNSSIFIPTYEVVQKTELKHARPIIILGPLKDQLNDALIGTYPDRFGSCVPHTTRSPRDNEIDKRDYHFVASREQMEQDISNHLFIEAGQYNGNLYGTSVASVHEVAEAGKHCILDVSGNAIRRLEVAGLHPIAIFVKPRTPEHIMELRRGITEDQARKAYERACKLEMDFSSSFTAVVSGDSLDEIFKRVDNVIRDQSGPSVWVASTDQNI